MTSKNIGCKVPKMNTKSVAGRASLFTLSGVIAVFSLFLGQSFTSVSATQEMVTICHATGSEDNPYTEVTAAYPAIYGKAGHFSEPGTTNEGHEHDYEGPCEGGSTPTATPTLKPTATPTLEATATPTIEPTLTPTPDTDVCDNIDGIQTGVPEGQHLDASGNNCVSFSDSNPPENNSTPQGQVLGSSTLASTGSFLESFYMAIMGIGATLFGKGLKKAKKA